MTKKSEWKLVLQKQKIQGVLDDLIVLCAKHRISIHPQFNGTANINRPTIAVDFGEPDWEIFEELEADGECASVYWPGPQVHIERDKRSTTVP